MVLSGNLNYYFSAKLRLGKYRKMISYGGSAKMMPNFLEVLFMYRNELKLKNMLFDYIKVQIYRILFSHQLSDRKKSSIICRNTLPKTSCVNHHIKVIFRYLVRNLPKRIFVIGDITDTVHICKMLDYFCSIHAKIFS